MSENTSDENTQNNSDQTQPTETTTTASPEIMSTTTAAPTDSSFKGNVDPSAFLDEFENQINTDSSTQTTQSPETNVVNKKPFTKNILHQDATTSLDPYSPGINKHRPETFITPAASLEEITARLNASTYDELTKNKASSDWAATVSKAWPITPFDNAANKILNKPDAKWVQRLQYGNISIGPSASRSDFEKGSVISGVQAINAVQRHLGIGGNFTAILPHSGFYITLKPPMEETILELHRQFQNIKTEVGRETYGLMLDSYSGLVSELFVSFALSEMQRNSLKDIDNILSIMSVHDINILLWSYICTMYPNGFNHNVACIAKPGECFNVVKDLINVRRLFYMDSTCFTQDMLKHLTSSAAGSMTADSINKYKQELKKVQDREIVICEGTDQETRFKLRVPSAKEYFDSTHTWIDGIGGKVVEALGADSTFNERNKLINEHAVATVMRKYSHWVESIDVGGIINNREDIENALDAMSSSTEVREEFSNKVKQYVEDTCFALIGIPDFKCPSCEQYQVSEQETDPLKRSIISIDVPLTFFTILVQRGQSVME